MSPELAVPPQPPTPTPASPPPLKKLSEVQHDEVIDCFAVLARKDSDRTKKDEPVWTCIFRDRRKSFVSKIWSNHRLFRDAAGWIVGTPYRLTVRGNIHPRWGEQVEVITIRPIDPARDAADGFELADLVEAGYRDPSECWDKIHDLVRRCVPDPHVKQLIELMLAEHRDTIMRIQAATSMHHAYTGGLIEHVWSLTRIAVFLAEHYERYYAGLNPPLNRSVVIAAAILHDIGKLRELEYDPVAARYTTPGLLIGHIVFGRDMVREAAARIDGFPAETLMLLEHAILSHHGKKEFGAVVEPATIEALIVSCVDDLDAKVNQVAAKLLSRHGGDGDFTDKVYGLANRRFYRGVPVSAPEDPEAIA